MKLPLIWSPHERNLVVTKRKMWFQMTIAFEIDHVKKGAETTAEVVVEIMEDAAAMIDMEEVAGIETETTDAEIVETATDVIDIKQKDGRPLRLLQHFTSFYPGHF